MAVSVFVAPQWVRDHMDDPDVVVVDVREPYFYGQGHLTTAVNLPITRLDTQNGAPPAPEALARLLGGLGIGRDTHVIVYDQGVSTPAARLYWLLEWIGHPRASILDGGVTRWRREGFDIDYLPVTPTSVDYGPAHANWQALARLEDVRAAIGAPDSIVLDVRAPAEYLGLQTTAMRDGHIPGALNLDWSNALERDANGIVTLLPEEKLRVLYETAGVTPDKEVIVQCQTGGRSSMTYAVLKSLGYERVRNYSAGWQEWGNRDDTPVDEE